MTNKSVATFMRLWPVLWVLLRIAPCFAGEPKIIPTTIHMYGRNHPAKIVYYDTGTIRIQPIEAIPNYEGNVLLEPHRTRVKFILDHLNQTFVYTVPTTEGSMINVFRLLPEEGTGFYLEALKNFSPLIFVVENKKLTEVRVKAISEFSTVENGGVVPYTAENIMTLDLASLTGLDLLEKYFISMQRQHKSAYGMTFLSLDNNELFPILFRALGIKNSGTRLQLSAVFEAEIKEAIKRLSLNPITTIRVYNLPASASVFMNRIIYEETSFRATFMRDAHFDQVRWEGRLVTFADLVALKLVPTVVLDRLSECEASFRGNATNDVPQ